MHEAEIYAGGFPETVDIDLADFPILEGINTLAVQVHNYTSNSSDLSCIPLTLGYGSIVDGVTEPNEYITIPNSFFIQILDSTQMAKHYSSVQIMKDFRFD